jgi:hypothetical protein
MRQSMVHYEDNIVPYQALTVAEKHHKIYSFENALFELPEDEQIKPEDVPVVHYFTPGLYCREIYMPAGVTLTSKIHKTEHLFIISKGRCTVATEHGTMELEAPYTGITKPGTKRALVIHEDTIWTTMHATDLTDVDEIEATIIAPTYEQYLLENTL